MKTMFFVLLTSVSSIGFAAAQASSQGPNVSKKHDSQVANVTVETITSTDNLAYERITDTTNNVVCYVSNFDTGTDTGGAGTSMSCVKLN